MSGVLRGRVRGGGVVPRARTRLTSVARSGGGARRPAGGQWRPVASGAWGGVGEGQLYEIQRSRLLAAAVGAIEELGYAQTTVEQITSRARVSRRTFYELFENREACLTAIFEGVAAAIEGEIAAAGLDGLAWRERVRGGLSMILSFLDREPALARVCVVQALRGGPRVLERREEVLARLAGLIDEGRGEGSRASGCTAVTAEGLVGAAFAIVYARLSRGHRAPLSDLLGELMSLIVLPYLGAAAARRELAGRTRARVAPGNGAPAHGLRSEDPLGGVPVRLTYRTARVLGCIADMPGASNRMVAERAGISDPGQISKLLARLQRLGLSENGSGGHATGEPNAWKLTPTGRQVVQGIGLPTNQKGAE
jgi:AcrR family transcriptional regulator